MSLPSSWYCCLTHSVLSASSTAFLESGHVFDIIALSSFITEKKRSPVTSEPLNQSQIVKAHFTISSANLICPLTSSSLSSDSKLSGYYPCGHVVSSSSLNKLSKDIPSILSECPLCGIKAKPIELFSNEISLSTGNVDETQVGSSPTPQVFVPLFPSPSKVTPRGEARVVFSTKYGSLTFLLFNAPIAVFNFISLIESNFYENSCNFYRKISKFMIQGGVFPLKPPSSIWSEPFNIEFTTLKHNSRGLLAMANKGPNTNTSEFYITFGRANHLDSKHSIFGKLVDGFEVLDLLEELSVNENTDELSELVEINFKVLVNLWRTSSVDKQVKKIHEIKSNLSRISSELPTNRPLKVIKK
ncbi:hypothetical protein RCL1_005829 [Eukaryota sp. TZLM3-RCL]